MIRKETTMEIMLMFVGGGVAWIMISLSEDPEDEITKWCRFHGINEDTVADWVTREVSQ